MPAKKGAKKKTAIPEVAEEPQPVEEPKGPKANVIWRGEKEPQREIQLGASRLSLPDAEEQRKGFYSAYAVRLVRAVRGYKYFNR